MASHIDLIMTLMDQVTAPLRDVQREMERTARLQQRLGRQVQQVGSGISSVGETLMPVAAGITALGAAGGRAFVDFDSIITGAAAKAGATAEEMELMRQKASQFGADFPISATQAAQGMNQLAAAGYDANQVIGVMPSVITAAVASGEDLAVTSDVVSNALNIWNLKQGDIAANAAHVADVVQMAANKSSLGMQDFGLAMQYAGAPAAALHVNIEDLSTAMAIMKNNGIEASTIGTSLRSVFSRLSAPPKEAADAIAQMGLQVKDAQGNFIGLKPVIDQMRQSMQGLSDTEQIALAKSIAGEDGYSGLLALIKTSPEAYQQMTDAMYNASGSSQAQFEVMKTTVKNSIDGMIGSLESLAINVGSVMSPQIKAAADTVGNFADMINNLSPEAKLLAADIAVGVVALTGFSLAAGKAVSIGGGAVRLFGDISLAAKGGSISNKALEVTVVNVVDSYQRLGAEMNQIRAGQVNFSTVSAAAGRSMRSFGASVRAATLASRAFIFSPIGIALMALAAVALVLYNNWSTIGPYFTRLWATITAAFATAQTTIQPSLIALMAAFRRLGQALSPLGNIAMRVFTVIAQGVGALLGVGLLVAVQAVIFVLNTLAGVLTGVIVMAVNVASATINMLIGVFTGLINFITGVFTGDWTLAWQGIVQIFSSIVSGIQGIFSGVIEGIRSMINSVIDGVNSINVTIPEWVPGFGGKSFGPLGVPRLAAGTESWVGGPVMIHDKGAEIVDLPSGTRVIPHDQSLKSAYAQGERSGRNSSGDMKINVNIYGASMQSGGDMKKLAEQVAQEIYYQMKKNSINMNQGAV